jgi:SAM-dependent methyltransferase
MAEPGIIMRALEDQWVQYENAWWDFEIAAASSHDLASFETIESILTSLPDVASSVLQERLEIIIGDGDYHGWCVQIDGIQNIKVYCDTANPWLVPARWMLSLVKDTRRMEDTYCVPMKSSVVLELEETPADVARSWWSSVPKFHRLKKIFEHKHMETGIVYQVTLERNMDTNNNTTTLRSALEETAVNPNVSHHVRARWNHKVANARGQNDGRRPATAPSGQHARNFYRHGMRLAAIARNEPVPMRHTEHEDVLVAFGKLIVAARRRPRQGEPRDERPFFLAPKPVTLEQVHLIDPETRYGAVSIQSDYCVTDKADGERMLLYVHKDGRCFLINNSLEVRSTGIIAKSPRLHGSVVDGEYIDASAMRFPGQKSMFAAFDVYFRNGQNLINRPLFADEREQHPRHRGGPGRGHGRGQGRGEGRGRGEQAGGVGAEEAQNEDPDVGKGRYDILKDMFEDLGFWNMSGANIALGVKKHRRASGLAIFEAAKATLLDAQKLPYANDGLIFTPANLYVWGVYANRRPVSVAPEMSRWDRVFKWKPAHMNSIDFLVRAVPEQRPDRQGFELMCGFNMVKNTPITVDDGMRYLHDPEERAQIVAARERYEPAPFLPHTYIEENANRLWLEQSQDGHCRALEGDVVTDDTIVECQWEQKEGQAGEWRAMRVREDKTRLYRASRNISRAANDMSTARNIWMTIHEPVTPEMITGVERITMADIEAKQAGVEERYYARDIARYHLLSVNMQNFHNLVIKKQLFEAPTVSYRRRLLELACGQAGDMSRWADSGYSVVVGVDLNRNNICDSMNGAYARAIRSAAESAARGDAHPPPTMAFMIGDCGKSFTTGEAFVDSPESEDLWRSLTKTNVVSYVAPVAAAFAQRSTPKFDAVSCQFAIHYFFESIDRLDAFLRNVADHLREGGYFMTSFMDGETVNELLRSEGPVVTGKVGGNTVWAIHKGYESFSPATGDAYSKDIHVYLETTRQSFKEYLVPFSVLKEHAAGVGLELHSSELFSTTFDRESRKQGDLKHIMDKLAREGVQRRFSGLNRWAVFRKK